MSLSSNDFAETIGTKMVFSAFLALLFFATACSAITDHGETVSVDSSTLSFSLSDNVQTFNVLVPGLEGNFPLLVKKATYPRECFSPLGNSLDFENGVATHGFVYQRLCGVCGTWEYEFSIHGVSRPGETTKVYLNIDCGNTDLLMVTSSKLRESDTFYDAVLKYAKTLENEGYGVKFVKIDDPVVQKAFATRKITDYNEWTQFYDVLEKIVEDTKPKTVLILGGTQVFPMPVLYEERPLKSDETDHTYYFQIPSDDFYSLSGTTYYELGTPGKLIQGSGESGAPGEVTAVYVRPTPAKGVMGLGPHYTFTVARIPTAPDDSSSKTIESVLNNAVQRHEDEVLRNMLVLTTSFEWFKVGTDTILGAVKANLNCDNSRLCLFAEDGYCLTIYSDSRKKDRVEKSEDPTGEKEIIKPDSSETKDCDKILVLQRKITESNFILLCAHGSPDSLAVYGYKPPLGFGAYSTYMSVNVLDASLVHASAPLSSPIVFLDTCYAAALTEKKDNLPISFLDSGTAAYVGSTSYGWAYFTPEIFSRILGRVREGETLGNAFGAVKKKYYDCVNGNPQGCYLTPLQAGRSRVTPRTKQKVNDVGLMTIALYGDPFLKPVFEINEHA